MLQRQHVLFKVKGLSIEHEKLAVAQSQSSGMDTSLESPTSRKPFKMLKEEQDGGGAGSNPSSNPQQHQQHQSSPSPSYSPAMSPYLQHPHYRQYEPHMGGAAGPGGGGSLRALRSPNEMLQESLRESVLRDGSKQGGRPGSPPEPMSMYR